MRCLLAHNCLQMKNDILTALTLFIGYHTWHLAYKHQLQTLDPGKPRKNDIKTVVCVCVCVCVRDEKQ